MLTADGCAQRRRNLWANLPERFEWVVIGDPRHVQYFSGFRVDPFSFSADQRSLLVILRSGETMLLTDNFARRSASGDVFADREEIVPWYNHRTSVTNRDHAMLEALSRVQSELSAGHGLLEAEGVPVSVAQLVSGNAASRFTDDDSEQQNTLGCVIRQLRRQKLPDEVQLLKTCMQATDAGHFAAFDAVRPGVSELDVYLHIQQAAQKAAGCPCVVYGDFRATNASLSKAGGLPTDYVLQDGDLFIVDYSVVIQGYRSDFTNTISVGAPNDAQIRQFEACRAALAAAEELLQSGAMAKDIDAAASASLVQSGFSALVSHCGHGLGMEHPEPPVIVPESSDTLLAGDVVTIEPGLYVEGVGGMRFEHNYLITRTGFERLSNHHIGLTRE